MQIRASSPDRPSLANRNQVTSDTTEGAVRRIMGKASNQKKKRRQGTGVSRADLGKPASPEAAGPGRAETRRHGRGEEGAPCGGQPLLAAWGPARNRRDA